MELAEMMERGPEASRLLIATLVLGLVLALVQAARA